jgi:molybdopterin-guanine dinucleotide biosynthesis protein A
MAFPPKLPELGAEFCAVVLTGGRAERMDGVDKGSVQLGGRTLLDYALDALRSAAEVVVVGDPVETEWLVSFVREDPPYSGPVAALLTGRDALLVSPRIVGVLAVDMPWVTAGTISRLQQAALGHDGAFLTDANGRRQLAGVIDAERLEQVRPDHVGQQGMALHELLQRLDIADVAPEDEDEGRDVDTWADLRSH